MQEHPEEAGSKESASTWRELFKDLKGRGLRAEKLIKKTGGKLITIEINEGCYKQALGNCEEAGLAFQLVIKSWINNLYFS